MLPLPTMRKPDLERPGAGDQLRDGLRRALERALSAVGLGTEDKKEEDRKE